MATAFDALLRIKAAVLGEGAISSLTNKLGGLQSKAAQVSSGFRGLAGAAGGLVGGLQTLLPLATGAGMVSLATNSMQGAEAMYDLSQSVGLSVEALSRFRRPAALAGIDIETVAKSLQRMSKSIATGQGSAVDGLKELGISSTNASGQLKTADQILLEVADRFAAMPDGIQKTGLAMQLFGKAGAEMIPMLNMGGTELAKFKGITTDYAKQADEAGDAMVMLQGKVGELGGQIARVLLPFMIQATNALTGLADGFNKLPGPVQVLTGGIAALVIAWGPLAGVIASVINLATVLSGLKIGATIAGLAGAIGPAMAAITAAFSGFLAFLTGTVLPGLLAFFSGPVGWTVLAVAAVVAMAIAFREPIMQFVSWLGGALSQGFAAAWELVKGPVMAYWEWWKGTATWALEALMAIAYQVWVQPWVNLWEQVLRKPVTAATTWMQETWQKMADFLPKAMGRARDGVVSVWTGVVNTIRSVINQVMSVIDGAINGSIRKVNNAIAAFNRLPGPDIGFVSTVPIPRFATGAYVTRPTIAQIAEGGEPEYVVPQSKAAAFAGSILSGRTGAQAIPAGRGGAAFTMQPATGSPAAAAASRVSIQIQTGPVTEMNGEKYVSFGDLERAIRQTVDGITGMQRRPAFRLAQGAL